MNEDEGSVKIMFYPYFVPGVIFSSMYTVYTTVLCDSRASFMVKLEKLLGDRYADFELLNSVEKTSYVLESEQNFTLLS